MPLNYHVVAPNSQLHSDVIIFTSFSFHEPCLNGFSSPGFSLSVLVPAQTWKRTITGKLREFNPRIAIHRKTPDFWCQNYLFFSISFGAGGVSSGRNRWHFFLQQGFLWGSTSCKGSLVIVQGLIIKGKFLQVAARCFDQSKSEMSRFLRIKS